MKLWNRPDIVALAKDGAEKLIRERGWSSDFSYKYALKKVSGGMAIMDSFNEFVRSGGDPNSLFYKYAMGDVFLEHQLFNTLNKS